jgi:peptide/nickel transport system substrate-binding protein
VSPAASAAASAAPSPSPSQAANENYPRAETLYTTGKQWGPPSTWNPLDPNAATGVVGLQYETLFLYDPLADKWTPWLAEGGTWTDPTTYTIKVRQGVERRPGPYGGRRGLHHRPREDQGSRLEHLELRHRCERDGR